MASILSAACGRFTPTAPQRGGVTNQEGTWFVGYLVSGRCDWFVNDEVMELSAGSVQVVPPGTSRSGYDYVIQACRAYWFEVDPGQLWRGSGFGKEVERRLRGALVHSVHVGSGLEPWFQRLCDDHAVDGEYALHQTESNAQFILLEIVRCIEEAGPAVRASGEGLPEAVSYAMNRFSSNVSALPTIQEVARELEMSRSHLHRLFVSSLGISPKAYVQELRLSHARELLKQGIFVHNIPAKISLATTGELRRLFKQNFGCQPEQWLSRQARLWQPKT